MRSHPPYHVPVHLLLSSVRINDHQLPPTPVPCPRTGMEVTITYSTTLNYSLCVSSLDLWYLSVCPLWPLLASAVIHFVCDALLLFGGVLTSPCSGPCAQEYTGVASGGSSASSSLKNTKLRVCVEQVGWVCDIFPCAFQFRCPCLVTSVCVEQVRPGVGFPHAARCSCGFLMVPHMQHLDVEQAGAWLSPCTGYLAAALLACAIPHTRRMQPAAWLGPALRNSHSIWSPHAHFREGVHMPPGA